MAPGIPEPAVLEVPEHFKKDPHKFVAQLNSGALPYQLAGKLTLSFLFSPACHHPPLQLVGAQRLV